MEKIKSTLPNIFLSLTTICLLAGLALSAANKYTAGAIAASKATQLENAIKNVTPEFDNNPMVEHYKIAISGHDSIIVYPVKKEGQYVGCAIESFTKEGFSGLIRVLVGFDAEDKLVNYSVLEHKETPGLGSKMESWFRENKNHQSIIGRDMTTGILKVSKDGGDIDAITASTISSRAFLQAINIAYHTYKSNLDAVSGATSSPSATETNTVDKSK
jgi:electron transport complex protein RnfG